MAPNQCGETVQTQPNATAVISAFGVTGESKDGDATERCDRITQREHGTLKWMTPPHVLLHCSQLKIIHTVMKCSAQN